MKFDRVLNIVHSSYINCYMRSINRTKKNASPNLSPFTKASSVIRRMVSYVPPTILKPACKTSTLFTMKQRQLQQKQQQH